MPGGLQEKHDPSGKTPPGGLWGDGTDLWIEPGTDEQKAAEQKAREQAAQGIVSASGSQAGFEFGERMRGLSGQAPRMVGVDTENIDRARVLGDQSYAQQQQALSMMRAQAQGQGPSVAALQGQAGLDAAGRQMMANRGGPMTAAMMSSAPQDAASQAAMGRAQEIQQAQGAWGQGADAMRGQSLQGQQQAMSGGWRATDLNLGQQQQNLERELALQRLSQGGYNLYSGAENDIRNIYAGVNASAAEAQRAANAGYLNMIGSSIGQAGGMIGAGTKGYGGGGYSGYGSHDKNDGSEWGN